MQKFNSSLHADEDEMVLRNQFRASFISHICKVKDQKSKYADRLQQFNTEKSVKVGLINQSAFEKNIY